MASKIAKVIEVNGVSTIAEVLSASKTDWDTALAPVVVNGREVPDHNAIVRPDTGEVLGIVGDRFKTNSHRAQLMQLEPLVQSGFIVPSNVSLWDHGARMAFQFRVPELDISVRDGDNVSPLLTLAFGLDGSFSDRTFLAKFRWFCKNQMGLVKEATGGVVVRHVGENERRYAELVTDSVKRLGQGIREDQAAMKRMLGTTLKGRELLGYFAESIGAEDPAAIVNEVWENGAEPSKLRGTARNVRAMLDSYREDDAGAPTSVWHAYNGVTRFVTHHEGRNPATRSERALLLGSGTIERGWEKAIKLAA